MEPAAPSGGVESRTAVALWEVTLFLLRESAALRDVSMSAAATLATLEVQGPSRISHLAEREHTAQPSMTAMIVRLERRGFVQRHRDPDDGRAVLASITDAGRRALAQRREGQVAFVAELLNQLGPSQQAAMAGAVPALGQMANPSAVPAALKAARGAVGRLGAGS